MPKERKITCMDYVKTKIGTLQSYSSSIMDKKLIGGCGIETFMIHITQCVAYIHI